jgi:hypothetical protein
VAESEDPDRAVPEKLVALLERRRSQAETSQQIGADDAHRVARVVEQLDGVTGVFPVLFERGRTYRVPYHYQLAVFARPHSPALGDIEQRIDDRLDELDISANWEHWGLRPKATLEKDGRRQRLLGSLIVPVHEASRSPMAPGVLPSAPITRLVTVLSSDYGGSKPVGGWLAEATGAGLMEGEEAARTRLAPRFRRRSIPWDDARRHETGWVNERLLRLLRHDGSAAGAWCLTTETRYPAGYEPLARALATTPDVLVVLLQGPEWRNMASWRLAKAQWDDDRREEARRSGDDALVLDHPQDGAELTRPERAAMENIGDRAEAVRDELAAWEDLLCALVAERADEGRPTVAVTLDGLPHDFRWARVRDDRWVVQKGSGAPVTNVNYLDEVDVLLDTWTEAAADALAGLMTLAGFDRATREAFFDDVPSEPLRKALRRTERARLSTRVHGALRRS